MIPLPLTRNCLTPVHVGKKRKYKRNGKLPRSGEGACVGHTRLLVTIRYLRIWGQPESALRGPCFGSNSLN